MPIPISTAKTVVARKQGELNLITVELTCDGVLNAIVAVRRNHLVVQRDDQNQVLASDSAALSSTFKFADLTKQAQDGLNALVAELDTKAAP